MANQKKPVHRVEMTEGKRNIIRQLLEEYDIETAEDIQDALKELHNVFLYQKVHGGAMQDIPSERHLKISTFRRWKPGVQPFWQLPSFSQNVDCFF